MTQALKPDLFIKAFGHNVVEKRAPIADVLSIYTQLAGPGSAKPKIAEIEEAGLARQDGSDLVALIKIPSIDWDQSAITLLRQAFGMQAEKDRAEIQRVTNCYLALSGPDTIRPTTSMIEKTGLLRREGSDLVALARIEPIIWDEAKGQRLAYELACARTNTPIGEWVRHSTAMQTLRMLAPLRKKHRFSREDFVHKDGHEDFIRPVHPNQQPRRISVALPGVSHTDLRATFSSLNHALGYLSNFPLEFITDGTQVRVLSDAGTDFEAVARSAPTTTGPLLRAWYLNDGRPLPRVSGQNEHGYKHGELVGDQFGIIVEKRDGRFLPAIATAVDSYGDNDASVHFVFQHEPVGTPEEAIAALQSIRPLVTRIFRRPVKANPFLFLSQIDD